jgi:hypothetical protein
LGVTWLVMLVESNSSTSLTTRGTHPAHGQVLGPNSRTRLRTELSSSA